MVEIDLDDKGNEDFPMRYTERANTNVETCRANMLHLKHFSTQTAFFSPPSYDLAAQHYRSIEKVLSQRTKYWTIQSKIQ